jgi:RHS repeat-associated protein
MLYYMHDGLGSVRQLLDATGEVETNYAYDPFGVPLAQGDVSNPYQYTGEAWDAEAELLYLRARYYQPEVGRFITKDPWAGDVWVPSTLNRYVYVLNNPVNLRDPAGFQGDGSVPNPWLPPPPQPHVVSRSEWRALQPGIYTIGCRVVAGYAERIYDPVTNKEGYAYYSQLRPGESLADILDTIVIHHEGNVQFYSVHMVQLSHMVREGYTDIGYHFVIGTIGTIYEGRRIDVRGTHVVGQNTGKIGVLLLGDFEPGYVTQGGTYPLDWNDDPGPTGEQVLSTIGLVRWLDYLYGIDSVKGHRQVEEQESVCPGERLMPFIPLFNAVAQER